MLLFRFLDDNIVSPASVCLFFCRRELITTTKTTVAWTSKIWQCLTWHHDPFKNPGNLVPRVSPLCLPWSQPHPQGLLLDDFQNGGSSGEDPGKGWVTWYKISKNLGDFYHVTFWEAQNKMAVKSIAWEAKTGQRTLPLCARGSDGFVVR